MVIIAARFQAFLSAERIIRQIILLKCRQETNVKEIMSTYSPSVLFFVCYYYFFFLLLFVFTKIILNVFN